MKKTKEDYSIAVKTSETYAETLRKLNLRVSGGALRTLKKYLDLYEIDYTHFKGRSHREGKAGNKGSWKATPIEQVLVENRFCSSNHLKERLIKLGLKERRCESCKLNMWLGKPIGLQLEHVNGKHDDNRIENLKILCLNCHYQTPTWGNKNKAMNAKGGAANLSSSF